MSRGQTKFMTKIFTRNVCFVMWPFIVRASPPLSALSPLSNVFVHSPAPAAPPHPLLISSTHTHVLSPYVSSHSAFPCPFIPMSNWLFVRFLFQMFSATFGAFYFLILVKSVKTRKNRAVSMHITYTFRMQALALPD